MPLPDSNPGPRPSSPIFFDCDRSLTYFPDKNAESENRRFFNGLLETRGVILECLAQGSGGGGDGAPSISPAPARGSPPRPPVIESDPFWIG